MNRRLGVCLTGLLAAVVFIAPGTVAFAVWSSTSTASLSITVADPPSVAAPTVSCKGEGLNPTLTWSAVDNATVYRIYRGTTAGGTPIKSVEAPQTSVSLIQADMGTPAEQSEKYSVVVTAVIGQAESTPSAPFVIQFKKNGRCAG